MPSCTTGWWMFPASRSWPGAGIPRAYFASPEKHGGHRALADILESIRELRYYREAVFVPLPGPDTLDGSRHLQRASSRPARRTGNRVLRSELWPGMLLEAAGRNQPGSMVGVAQLAERQVVVLDVVGSSPIVHPE